jgi:hypothetical protein
VKGEGRCIAGEEKAYPEIPYQRESMEATGDHKQIVLSGKVMKTRSTERSKNSVKWDFHTNQTMKAMDRDQGTLSTCRQKIMEVCQMLQFLQGATHLLALATLAGTVQRRLLINLRHQ